MWCGLARGEPLALLDAAASTAMRTVAGRSAPEDITLDESLGIALEDLAAAHFIHRRAVESGAGPWLGWGGPS